MAQILPKWSNAAPRRILVTLIVVFNAVVCGFGYIDSPEYLDIGYAPEQPVPFSHKTHAGQLGMNCQYCHTQVFDSRHANIPATQTCMNCHNQIETDNENLELVRQS